MYAKLFDAPQDIDAKIARMARVSSDNPENPEFLKLIKYLITEGHWSPFDMMNVVIEIETEKDVAIQILRHSGLKPQEYSQRYADCSEMLAVNYRECRLQDFKNRQNSINCKSKSLSDWWEDAQEEVVKLTYSIYDQALSKGIAKEVARSVLPIGLTKTKMFLNGSVRTWLFYLLSRTDASTQKEHRFLAEEIKKLLESVAPVTCEAFFSIYGKK